MSDQQDKPHRKRGNARKPQPDKAPTPPTEVKAPDQTRPRTPEEQAEWLKRCEERDAAMVDTLARARQQLRPWQVKFIEALTISPNITLACGAGNVSRTIAYKQREENEAFRELWDEALEGHTDAVEGALHDVAVHGHERTIYGRDGTVKGVEKTRDVNAMKFWLSGNRPKTYRETHGPLVNVNLGTSDEALTKALESGFLAEIAHKLTTKGDSPT